MSFLRFLTLIFCLVLPVHDSARAETLYDIQPIVRVGDRVGNVLISGEFEIGALNDLGQLVFVTRDASGSQVLFHFSKGRLTPLVAGGEAGPIGTWPRLLSIAGPVSMNQQGTVVFTPLDLATAAPLGTFLWDDQARMVEPATLKGMPAAQNLVFEIAGGLTPAINNRGDIALVAQVRDTVGAVRDGIFVLGADGQVRPVILSGQVLPDGRQLLGACCPSINDAGAVGFLATRQGDTFLSAFLWEPQPVGVPGKITPVAVIGADAPGGGKFAYVDGVWGNNRNRSVLVMSSLDEPEGQRGIYRFADGRLTSVVVPGQPMPGGGSFTTGHRHDPISFANDLGQHVFVTQLEEGATAAYRIDADGQLALIVKSGMTTPLGRITQVGQGTGSIEGVGVNNRGQVALTVKVDGGPDTLVLLTPR
jgi:hypothetical protein